MNLEDFLLSNPDVGEHHVVITEKDLPVRNFFGDGWYGRELWRPAGTFILGHTHTTAHLCMVTKGCINVYADGIVSHKKKGDQWLASAGGRKATFVPEGCLEGATLVTFHVTTKTDMKELEDELIEKSPAFDAYELKAAQEALK